MESVEPKPIHLYGTDSLCFDKDDFMKKNFNVDTFVQIHQASGSGGLESLRDDLGIYLKILRSAMIDLINRDYADFVNLSTNLTGLDSLIESLKTSLGQLREEVLCVERLLSEAIESVTSDLQRKHTINQQKALLQRLSQIAIRLERLETLLKSREINTEEESLNSSCDGSTTGNELVDRLATEVNHLNFLVSQCEGAALLNSFKPRVEAVCSFVEVGLERGLREGIQEGDKQLLLQTLRTYASLGTVHHAHQQVRTIIRGHLEEVISDSALKSDPRGLHGMFEKTLNSVKSVCCPLLIITIGNGSDVVPGFFFLEDAAWPEIIFALETRTQFIFNPGNPDTFHKRYEESLRFLDQFEELLQGKERIIAFRKSDDYHKFWEQWNLPVYFQIRYQEIGEIVESVLCYHNVGLTRASNKSKGFYLNSTQTVWENLVKCFSSDIFMLPLLHRFWKLFLLILSRYRIWADQTSVISKGSMNESPSLEISRPSVITEKAESVNSLDTEKPLSGVYATVFVLHDIQTLASKVETFYEDNIEHHVTELPADKKNIMKEAMTQQVKKLLALKSGLIDAVVSHLIGSSWSLLKQVTDTPRIYRRTNKPIPSTNQPYISSALQPILSFHDMSKGLMQQDDILQVLHKVFLSLSSKFHSMIYEVLSSVHKMEESLRRLKRARDRGLQPGSDALGPPSDDDKIRIQIYLDVVYLGDQMSALGLRVSSVEHYQALLTMVEDAKEGKFTP